MSRFKALASRAGTAMLPMLHASMLMACIGGCEGNRKTTGSPEPSISGILKQPAGSDAKTVVPKTPFNTDLEFPAQDTSTQHQKEMEKERRRAPGRLADEFAKWQRSDGLWNGREADENHAPPDLAFSALVLLLYEGAGQTMNHGTHNRTVRKAMPAVIRLLEANFPEMTASWDIPGVFTYAVFVWTVGLELQTKSGKALESAGDAALGRLLAIQNWNGSWDSPIVKDDILYTAWAVLAIREFHHSTAMDIITPLGKAYDFLMQQIGANGLVDPEREEDYFRLAFKTASLGRPIRLLSAAALTGICRVRGVTSLSMDLVKTGFKSLGLEFPLQAESEWKVGLLEWLWIAFAYWAHDFHPWKHGLYHHMLSNLEWGEKGPCWSIPDPPFADPDGRFKMVMGFVLRLFAFRHSYARYPDLLEKKSEGED